MPSAPWVPRFSFAIALLAAAMAPSAARAVDLTGVFRTELTVIGIETPPLVCSLTFVQTGTILDAAGSCGILSGLVLTGTINPTFGTFSLTGSVPVVCPTLAITGIGAGNSASFSAFYTCSGGIIPLAGTISGTRCGNELLDAGETCDDGNRTSGDCCSATCQLEPANAPCASDGNPCTDDRCDGAGSCLHPDNTSPCDDGLACTGSDACSAGSCHGAFLDGGAACDDGTPCTPDDTCDGAGTCVPAGVLDCGPCMACETGAGCSTAGLVGTSCVRPVASRSTLQLKDVTADQKDQATWRYVKGGATLPNDFGNPAATTGYRLCIYGQSGGNGYDQALLGLEIPAGLGWVPTSSGYKFKSKTGDVRRAVLRAGIDGKTKLLVKAKGSTLALPPLPVDLANPILVQLHSADGPCWEATYGQASTNTTTRFTSRVGSPSGAFVP